MNLPPLTIPDLPLPIAIPEMMHPAIVHFAVALPVIIILLELINLAVRRKLLGSISFLLMVLMALVYLGAYLTGSVDAHKAKDLLSPEAKTLLDAHKNGGIWLVYGSLGVILFKLISVTVKKIPVRIVYLLVLGLFFWGATSVVQKGCALTYKHGVNVHKDAVSAAEKATPAPAAHESAETVPAKSAPATTAPAAEETPKAEASTEHPKEEKPASVIDAVKEKATAAVETVKATATDAAKAVKETTADVVEKAGEMAESATETVKETASEATHQVEKAVDAVTQPADAAATPHEAAQEAAQ